MAKFLNTSAVTYYLEEMIKNANERLILISPYLRLNDKIKELLEDKNRLKIDIRIIYGKKDLIAEEANWLHKLEFVRISFCKNLHAKCYMNEKECIITSLNLYEFSQVNNNEMGILISKNEDYEIFKDAQEEANRIIRISDEVRAEKLEVSTLGLQSKEEGKSRQSSDDSSMLTTAKLAAEHQIKTKDFIELLVKKDYLLIKGKAHYLTKKGTNAGGVWRKGFNKSYFILWPENFKLD